MSREYTQMDANKVRESAADVGAGTLDEKEREP